MQRLPRSRRAAGRRAGAAGIAGPRGTRALPPLRLGSTWARGVRRPRAGTGPGGPAAPARRPRRRALAGASHDVEAGTPPLRLGPRERPMTTRAAVTPALLEEYCARFRNWGRWGSDDEIGTLNFITPDVITRAARLVRQGKVISCALNFDTSGPQTGAFGRVNPIHSMVATGTDHATADRRWRASRSFRTAGASPTTRSP